MKTKVENNKDTKAKMVGTSTKVQDETISGKTRKTESIVRPSAKDMKDSHSTKKQEITKITTLWKSKITMTMVILIRIL